VDRPLKAGNSDWAIFRAISEGMPDTPMERRDLPAAEMWQITTFVSRTIAGTGPSQDAVPALTTDVPFERLRDAGATPGDWLMYSGTYDGQRHSRLAAINRDTIKRLRVRWLFQAPTDSGVIETTPIVTGEAMYVSLPPGDVWALDTRTGSVLWHYRGAPRPAGLKLSVEPVNRGLAILGKTLFLARIDARLVALDANTGRELWNVEVADYKQSYSMTGAPLALRDRVIVGVGGGEFGIRGFVDAYSATDGKRLWRTYTVPAPGEPGNETWGTGDAWKTGSAPTWLTGSYDPALDLVYWGVGNPGPDFTGDARPGDNLFSNSVIALEGATGKMRWHFQFTPHDERDWDSVQVPVLADAPFRGQPRPLMFFANRNGFYYVLDRATGQFLHGRPFVAVSWADGLDPQGRPIENAATRPTTAGTPTSPPVNGATNWWSPAYDPEAHTFFVGALEGQSIYTKTSELPIPSYGVTQQAVRALDAFTGERRWEYVIPGRPRMGGLLSTAGGLVFGSDRSRLFALDNRQGALLWEFNTGDTINAAPITYLSEGRQQVTLAAGRTFVTFALDIESPSPSSR
jgi:alcohol dehydrogenase (cytochrome c)